MFSFLLCDGWWYWSLYIVACRRLWLVVRRACLLLMLRLSRMSRNPKLSMVSQTIARTNDFVVALASFLYFVRWDAQKEPTGSNGQKVGLNASPMTQLEAPLRWSQPMGPKV